MNPFDLKIRLNKKQRPFFMLSSFFKRICLWSAFIALLFYFGCADESVQMDPGYFQEVGDAAVYQRALDVENDINVLSIAIEPGFEDLETLAYFRFARGANIFSAYVTNGEGGESDLRGEFGNYRAATRRNEAKAAVTVIGAEAHFLNFADIVAYRDRQSIEQVWRKAHLQEKLKALLAKTQPDMILLASNDKELSASMEQQVLIDALRSAAMDSTAQSDETAGQGGPAWRVERVYVRTNDPNGLSVAIGAQHPKWKKSYREIAAEAAQKYRSIAVQRKNWLANQSHTYMPAFEETPTPATRLDEGLPIAASPKLQGIEQGIKQLTQIALDGNQEQALKTLATWMDSVIYRLPEREKMTTRENRSLLMWKKGLDELRNSLLGVKVHYTISDTALTALQLTFLNISKVEGIREEGKTRLFFGGLANNGWVINEASHSNLPLVFDDPYRLVTPGDVEFNVPFATNGLKFENLGSEMLFFVMHSEQDPAYSFIHRSQVNIDFVPRFETEVLTPIVRMGSGTEILLKLQNHSRDGVVDTVKIDHEFANAEGQAFRLSNKEDSQLITFYPVWNSRLGNGKYQIPIMIHGDVVAQFTAIKFDARAETGKKVGLLTGIEASPLQAALTNLQMDAQKITLDKDFEQQLDSIDVFILDKRVMTLLPDLSNHKSTLDRFVERGGHLIVLAQDASVWNVDPLIPGIELEATSHHYGELPVSTDAGHPFLAQPNAIQPQDWHDWLFLRSHNVVSISDSETFEQPIKAQDSGAPLLVTQKVGAGRKTYVDLALSHQLQHVHAGAFRLFANIVSE